MKITLKVPIVKQSPAGSWEKYQVDGSLDIEGDFQDHFDIRKQANTLLAEFSAEYQLIVDSRKIEQQVDDAKSKLSEFKSQIQVAQNQLHSLTRFSISLGVDARNSYLTFDEQLKLRSARDDDDDSIPFG